MKKQVQLQITIIFRSSHNNFLTYVMRNLTHELHVITKQKIRG